MECPSDRTSRPCTAIWPCDGIWARSWWPWILLVLRAGPLLQKRSLKWPTKLVDSLRRPLLACRDEGEGRAGEVHAIYLLREAWGQGLGAPLLERFPDWDLLHQTGAGTYPELASLPRHPRHKVAPFLEFMDRQMEASTLVVTRSGASTCAELKAAGRPSLMVPMPGSAGDHQTANARATETRCF